MNLIIDFSIKNGRKIITKETTGYTVILSRIKREFINSSARGSVTIKVIIQTSFEGAVNKRNKYAAIQGTYTLSKNEIKVFTGNCIDDKRNIVDFNRVLEVLAHEFGHAFHHHTNYQDFKISGTLKREKIADDFAEKIMKTELSKKSMTGRVKYARVKRNRI